MACSGVDLPMGVTATALLSGPTSTSETLLVATGLSMPWSRQGGTLVCIDHLVSPLKWFDLQRLPQNTDALLDDGAIPARYRGPRIRRVGTLRTLCRSLHPCSDGGGGVCSTVAAVCDGEEGAASVVAGRVYSTPPKSTAQRQPAEGSVVDDDDVGGGPGVGQTETPRVDGVLRNNRLTAEEATEDHRRRTAAHVANAQRRRMRPWGARYDFDPVPLWSAKPCAGTDAAPASSDVCPASAGVVWTIRGSTAAVWRTTTTSANGFGDEDWIAAGPADDPSCHQWVLPPGTGRWCGIRGCVGAGDALRHAADDPGSHGVAALVNLGTGGVVLLDPRCPIVAVYVKPVVPAPADGERQWSSSTTPHLRSGDACAVDAMSPEIVLGTDEGLLLNMDLRRNGPSRPTWVTAVPYGDGVAGPPVSFVRSRASRMAVGFDDIVGVATATSEPPSWASWRQHQAHVSGVELCDDGCVVSADRGGHVAAWYAS